MATKDEKNNGKGVEEPVVEEQATEETTAGTEPEATKDTGEIPASSVGGTINEAVRQVEKQVGNISKALGSALQDRANVVMVRVNDDSLHYLDVLVEADITRSRSESAAFLINEGIKANAALFNKISDITDQIVALKAQLRESVQID
jgi:hypothetical protein